MPIDRAEAANALHDIAVAEQRLATASIYGVSAAILMLWGALVALGYLATQFDPAQAGWAWLGLDLAGVAGMAWLLAHRRPLLRTKSLTSRILAAQVALVGFGVALSAVLAPLTWRQVEALWPLFFMLGYVLAGLWVGRFFVVCGLVVAALTVLGYFVADAWYPLWMAVAEGGALFAGGLWLRRVGATA